MPLHRTPDALSLRLHRDTPIDGLRLNLGVDRIFDENCERVFQGVSRPGTHFKIAASWQFGQKEND